MAMVTVTTLSNSMSIRTDRLYLQACQRNMKAWAWARANADQLSEKLSDGPLTLETESLHIPDGRLVLAPAPDAATRLQVAISCSKRKATLNRTANFSIAGAD